MDTTFDPKQPFGLQRLLTWRREITRLVLTGGSYSDRCTAARGPKAKLLCQPAYRG